MDKDNKKKLQDNFNNLNNLNNGKNNGGRIIRVLLITAAIVLIVMSFMKSKLMNSYNIELPYDEFMQMVDDGDVESVVINDSQINIRTKKTAENYSQFSEYYTIRVDDDATLVDRLYKAGVEIKRDRSDTTGVILAIANILFPLLLFIFFIRMLSGKSGGGGGIMGVGKSNAKVYMQKKTGVTFDDVAGVDEAKESLVELVEFLHDPTKFTEIGARLPKGALLVGPPGTGKTLLAKAVAGEAGVPFFSLTGSDFVEMFVGVGASRVRDLFKQAQAAAPCIIFIDEIDAIGKSRDTRFGGGNDEREQTLNQLLSEMDGFDSSKGLLVIGATNRPEILDPALLRPGRFDRRVIVERPDLKGRVAILKVHAKDVTMDESVDLEAIGLATSGAVGSDLANMINEGAILAVKKGRKAVCQDDLLEAVEVVLVGKEKKDRVLNDKEKRIVAYHEVGHALISALLKNTDPVQKITIVPRTMGALGYTMLVPEEETYLKSKKELEEMITGLLGGRAAEEVVFDTITTGAANDIERATGIAKAMITQYGMSDKFGLMGLARIENQYLSGRAVMDCGDATATAVDEETRKLLKGFYEQALELLRENRSALDQIAEFLIEKETITGKEFMNILHRINGWPEEETPNEENVTEKAEEVPTVENSSEQAEETQISENNQTLSEPENA